MVIIEHLTTNAKAIPRKRHKRNFAKNG